jgi:hypothetical protein
MIRWSRSTIGALPGFPQGCHGRWKYKRKNNTPANHWEFAGENGYELNERGALLCHRALLFLHLLSNIFYFCLPLKTERHLIN